MDTHRPRYSSAALALLALLAASPPVWAQERPELARHFEAFGAEGSFVLYDTARQGYVRYHRERARRGFLPASTFKIPNSLIALETGVVADEHVVFPWDGVDRGRRAWNRDHDLESAFEVSAVWFYQELARRIGEARMRDFLARIGYGNEDIGGGIDAFWLQGELRISAEEQIAFLRRLRNDDLPFAPRSMEIVRRIMKIEEGDGYVLRGKTGWSLSGDEHHGWLVGWVEKSGGDFLFALELSGRGEDFPMFRARREILDAVLAELGITE